MEGCGPHTQDKTARGLWLLLFSDLLFHCVLARVTTAPEWMKGRNTLGLKEEPERSLRALAGQLLPQGRGLEWRPGF